MTSTTSGTATTGDLSAETAAHKMDAEIKAKWVEALRSGEYRQTRGLFQDEVGYCCLGVLCVVTGKPPIERGNGIGNWSAAENAIGGNQPYKIAMMLAGLNDDGKSFAEIADYIEANL